MNGPRKKLELPRVRLFAGLGLMLRDLGISARNVMRRAGLPDDRLSRPEEPVDRATYLALWNAIEAEAADPLLPLRFGLGVRVETFDPLLFAALCSEDLRQALGRIERYKTLQGMQQVAVTEGRGVTRVEVVWPGEIGPAPAGLILTEIVFLLAFARTATRERVKPDAVNLRDPSALPAPMREFFDCPVTTGAAWDGMTFSRAVVTAPFLTANAATVAWFEPALSPHLTDLAIDAPTAARVRAALLEVLPGTRPSVQSVGRRLGLSARTVQRRLLEEGHTFQSVLDATRLDLANWYLTTTKLPHTEIAYLLGFEEPKSFHRAYRHWTGVTPEQHRSAHPATTPRRATGLGVKAARRGASR